MSLLNCSKHYKLFPKCASRVRNTPYIKKVNFHVCTFTKKIPSVSSLNLVRSTYNVNVKRTFLSWFKRPTISKFKEIDDIPSAYELIYRNTMERYLFWAQLITVASSVAVIITVILTDLQLQHESQTVPEGLYKLIPVKNEDLLTVVGFTVFVVIIHIMLSKMPIRIYYLPQQQTYQFIFYGNMPFTTNRTVCGLKDIRKIKETGFLPWRDDRYKIMKTKQDVIMFEQYFRRPADLNVMLGYQKDTHNDDEE